MKSKIVLLILVLLVFMQTSKAHPFGITISNLTYAKHELKFSTRVVYDDFVIEFRKNSQVKGKNYVRKGFDDTDKQELQHYFQENVRIFIDGKELKLRSIKFSFDLHEEDVYIFIAEVSYKTRLTPKSKIRIQDTILLNSVKGQTNLINVYLKDPVNPSHDVISLNKQNPTFEFVNK